MRLPGPTLRVFMITNSLTRVQTRVITVQSSDQWHGTTHAIRFMHDYVINYVFHSLYTPKMLNYVIFATIQQL